MHGSGFYAMWNNIDPGMAPGFDLMHARHHMLDHLAYLGEDAILSARRHTDGYGTLPRYFTFYDMSRLSVLTDDAHRHCKVTQSDWFQQYRPFYRDHIRHHCNLRGRSGGGGGGSVATLVFQLRDTDAMDELFAELTSRSPFTAAHWGVADPTLPTMVGGEPPPGAPAEEPCAVIILESYDRHVLAEALPALVGELTKRGCAGGPVRWAHYALSIAVEHKELGALLRLKADPSVTC